MERAVVYEPFRVLLRSSTYQLTCMNNYLLLGMWLDAK